MPEDNIHITDQTVFEDPEERKPAKSKTPSWLWVPIALAAILLIWLVLLLSGRTGETARVEAEKYQSENAQQAGQIADLKKQVADLNKQIAGLTSSHDQTVADLNANIRELARNRKITIGLQLPKTTAPAAKKTELRTETVKPPETGQTSTAQATTITPTKKIAAPVTEVPCPIPLEFCVQVNGEYWPHSAMNRGVSFAEIRDNGVGGYNLLIKNFSAEVSGPYGIKTDGTIFVREDQFEKCDGANLVSNYTGWKPSAFKKVDGYYIWHQ